MKAAATALVVGAATAKDISLTWKDCGGASTKTKITGFTPASVTLGQKTKMTGTGQLSEEVTGANFDLTMSGALGTLLHCSGDASVAKTCSLPLNTGSLTFDAMQFPIAAGKSAVNVDISLSSALPSTLTKTKTITKATAKNGDELFCMEIDSASANFEQDKVQEGWCVADGGRCGSYKVSQCCDGLTCKPPTPHGPLVTYVCSPPSDLDSASANSEQDKVEEVTSDLAYFVAGGSLKLDWKDCGDASTKTKITGFSPSTVVLGQKTKITGTGQLREEVTGANFELSMSGALGSLLHCTGDASVAKTCSLPLNTGSLTFDAMKFPIAAGTSAVNVDISLSSTLPAALLKTKTITKATAKNGDELFCMEIDSSSASSNQAQNDFVEGGTLKLDWQDCGDSSYHAKVKSLSPTALVLGQKTTVTGSGDVDEQVTGGKFAITAKFGPVTKNYDGDVCSAKTFHLPAMLGTITWDGVTCPHAKGTVNVPVDVQLSSLIPASLAKGTIEIKGTGGSQENLICLKLDVSKQSKKVFEDVSIIV